MSISAALEAFAPDPGRPLPLRAAEVIDGGSVPLLTLDIGRTWHALATLLTSGHDMATSGVDDALNPIFGGTPFGDDDGPGRPHVYSVDEVRAVAARLHETTNEDALAMFDTDRFETMLVYPGGWTDGAGSALRPELERALDEMRRWYYAASGQSLAVVVEFY